MNLETEDRLRKGLTLYAGMLQHNGIPVQRALNGVDIHIGSNHATSYDSESGRVNLDSDFEPEDVPHELKHRQDHTAIGMVGSNALRDIFYTEPTRKIFGTFLDSNNNIIDQDRIYSRLAQPGIDPYMALATGFGFPVELEPQTITRLLFDQKPEHQRTKDLQQMIRGVWHDQTALPPAVIQRLSDSLKSVGEQAKDEYEDYLGKGQQRIPYNDTKMASLATQTVDAMQQVARQIEVLKNRLAFYHNMALAHLKRLQKPNKTDTESIQRNYDGFGIGRPASFDKGDIDGLREVLKNPIDRSPNVSIMSLFKQASRLSPRVVPKPEFD